MPPTDTRRAFLGAAAAGAFAGLGDLSFLASLRPVSAQEATLAPPTVRLDAAIEPLVKLLETTERESLLEVVAAKIRGGLAYRDLLAALLLAGVRNVEPRPSVGFKFHAVLVVHAAHLASLASPDSDRWLPIFWALDNFKSSQARDQQERNWTMGPVDEQATPRASRARQAFIDAMDRWDEPAADAAVAGLVRSAGAGEIFELFYGYGARDFRSIGHKAIFVANSFRTLQCIGWQHAEPVLRSLTYALLNHEGDGNPVHSDFAADRPWRRNESLAAAFRPAWQEGARSSEATVDMLAVLRTGSADDCCDKVASLVNQEIAPQAIWDALLGGAAELLMRRPGIVALHAVTTTNALHFAYQAAASDNLRRRLLLQNGAFLPMFREAMRGDGEVAAAPIDQLEPLALNAQGGEALAEIFADVSRDPASAARKTLALLDADSTGESPHESAQALMDTARKLIFLKGTDSHDYKFSSAVLEDFFHASPAWRNRYLAASVYHLRGSDQPDNPLVSRARKALGA